MKKLFIFIYIICFGGGLIIFSDNLNYDIKWDNIEIKIPIGIALIALGFIIMYWRKSYKKPQ